MKKTTKVSLNKNVKKPQRIREPKILFFDIETFANQAFVWGKYEQNVIAYEKEWFMMCYAYKWLGEKKTHIVSLPQFKSYKKNKEDDKELVKSLWTLFDQADIVIAHNGNSFDIKKTNARFIFHKLPPPSPYQKIDTKLVAKRYFNFNSNKLDDLGNYFGLGRKLDTGGWELWYDCWKGDMKAWAKMEKYNKQDVDLLELVYLEMLPYMTNHPNVALMEGNRCACPNCGSDNVEKRGFSETRVTRYQKWSCNDCRSWHRSPISGGQIR